MQLHMVFTALISLQMLANAAAVGDKSILPRMAKSPVPRTRPESLVYIRSWDYIICPGQGKYYYDFIQGNIVLPNSRTFWNETAKAFRYTWYNYLPAIAKNQIYFHAVRNNGFDQYRFTKAQSTDQDTSKVASCTFYDQYKHVTQP